MESFVICDFHALSALNMESHGKPECLSVMNCLLTHTEGGKNQDATRNLFSPGQLHKRFPNAGVRPQGCAALPQCPPHQSSLEWKEESRQIGVHNLPATVKTIPAFGKQKLSVVTNHCHAALDSSLSSTAHSVSVSRVQRRLPRESGGRCRRNPSASRKLFLSCAVGRKATGNAANR